MFGSTMGVSTWCSHNKRCLYALLLSIPVTLAYMQVVLLQFPFEASILTYKPASSFLLPTWLLCPVSDVYSSIHIPGFVHQDQEPLFKYSSLLSIRVTVSFWQSPWKTLKSYLPTYLQMERYCDKGIESKGMKMSSWTKMS